MNQLLLLFLASVPFSFLLALMISKFSDHPKPTLQLYGFTLIIILGLVYASQTWSANPAADFLFWVFLFLVAAIDYETKTIIDVMVYVGAILLLVISVLEGATLMDQLLGGLVGFCSYGVIYLLAKLFYKREAFGFGDVLLNGAIGIYLGVQMTLLSSLLTFYVALLAIVISKVVGKIIKRQHEIAFAPYMAIAAGVVSLWGAHIIRTYVRVFL